MKIDDVKAANVTIKKDQGVTHSLKDLVKNLKLPLSDGSISKAEWNETIKVLDSIQQQRVKDGRASLFGDNYLVHAGDKIEFTADEMKQIYTAMGVEFDAGAKSMGKNDKINPKPDKKPEPSPKPTPTPSSKPSKKITPQERNQARHYGSNVSDYLVGFTDDSEKGLTKEVITKHVNNRNVLDFLAGYEKNRGMGDHFFKQLHSEYGFKEKQNLMKNVAIKLSQYLKANGQPRLAREVDVALADNGFSMSETQKLDQIVQTMLTTVPGLKV